VFDPVNLNKVDHITNGNYFGGEEYIPGLEDQEMSLPNTPGGKNGQQTFGTS
jgi:hypothetical protein